MSGSARLASWLYSLCLPPDEQSALGDLFEEHGERVTAAGRPAADRWIWRQVLLSAIPSLFTSPTMVGWRRPLTALLTGAVVFYGLGMVALGVVNGLGARVSEPLPNAVLFAAYTLLSAVAAYLAGRAVAMIGRSAATLVALSLIVVVLLPEIIGLFTGRSAEALTYRLIWETLIPITLFSAARRQPRATVPRPAP